MFVISLRKRSVFQANGDRLDFADTILRVAHFHADVQRFNFHEGN